LLRELEVDVTELAPEARKILGGRPEVRARQALHNGLVWVKSGRAAPLALDGVAGLKTRAGFTRILESIGPDRMARDIAEKLRRT
jgi:hypothetical protein